MYINSSEAQKILQAAQAKAQQMGVKVSISVVDGRGDLLTMVRLDGASWRTALISKGKAYASANFGVASADLTARATSPVMQSFMLQVRGEAVLAQGAVPVLRNGQVAGAVGVSGAKSEEDEEIAKAGIAAL
jgi:uncharacterized protein GlcG (DUF336 family)